MEPAPKIESKLTKFINSLDAVTKSFGPSLGVTETFRKKLLAMEAEDKQLLLEGKARTKEKKERQLRRIVKSYRKRCNIT